MLFVQAKMSLSSMDRFIPIVNNGFNHLIGTTCFTFLLAAEVSEICTHQNVNFEMIDALVIGFES